MKKFFCMAAVSLCLLLGLSAAASGVTVEVQGGYSCDYGVDIPFTPSARTSRYTFALYAGGNAVGSPEVTAEVTIASAGTVHLPLRHNLSGPSTWTLCVTAHPMPGREAFDREAMATKVFTTAPTCGCPAGTAGAFYAGKGIAGSPFLVASSQQLRHIEAHLSAHYKQAGHIDCGGANWAPIGHGYRNTAAKAFTDVYDGDGYTVSNLNLSGTSMATGLFSTATGATFQNLGLKELSVYCNRNSSESGDSAALVGATFGGTKIMRCWVEDTSVISAQDNSGGLSGFSDGTEIIEDCYTLRLSCQGWYGYGIGYNSQSIKNCYVVSSYNNRAFIGGIAINTDHSAIQNCYWLKGPTQAALSGTSVSCQALDSESDFQTGNPFSGWSASVWRFTAGEFPKLAVERP